MQLEVIDIYGIGVFGHQKNDKTIDVYVYRWLSFSKAFSAWKIAHVNTALLNKHWQIFFTK